MTTNVSWIEVDSNYSPHNLTASSAVQETRSSAAAVSTPTTFVLTAAPVAQPTVCTAGTMGSGQTDVRVSWVEFDVASGSSVTHTLSAHPVAQPNTCSAWEVLSGRHVLTVTPTAQPNASSAGPIVSSASQHFLTAGPTAQPTAGSAGAVIFSVSQHFLAAGSAVQQNTSPGVAILTHNVVDELYGITANIQRLNPGDLVTLFELDTTSYPGGELFRFHAGVNGQLMTLYWRGNAYAPLPIEADGFEWRGQGALPRPRLKVANITGLLGAAVREMNDLVGCRVTRRRTFFKYMDKVNFPGNVNPLEDWTAEFPVDVFYVNRKVSENKVMIEFELSSAMDVQDVKLPRRQVIANLCPWKYRGPECGYTGGPVATSNDTPTSNPNLDVCGKRLSSCELRHDRKLGLPYGGFPGSGLVSRS